MRYGGHGLRVTVATAATCGHAGQNPAGTPPKHHCAMTPIIPRDHITQAYHRALALHACPDTAAHAVAQALCLPVEAVRECIEPQEQPA